MGVSALSIPTYLRFACGHEAMVSLPRISGENARDRERRIAEEKASATLRRCDFCPPLELPAMEAEPDQNGHVAVDGAVEAIAELVEQLDDAVATVSAEQLDKALATVSAEQPAPAQAAIRIVSKRAPARPRGRPPRTAIAAAVIQRFSVVFRAETVVEARTLNEALDRAEALGAGDITGITRIA